MRRLERSSQRAAFTLIEMMVVILILAIVTSMASLSLGGVMDRYQLGRAAETLEAFDSQARREASRSREGVLAIIRRGTNELILRNAAGQSMRARSHYRMPRKVEIGVVRMQRKALAARDVTITLSDRGRSPTYAVELKLGAMSRWIIILGISGQVIPAQSEDQVDAILSL
jgi:prepilin-type N-terminal cleavage/methylation domain-containing protein